MGPYDGMLGGGGLKPLAAQKVQIQTQTVKVTSSIKGKPGVKSTGLKPVSQSRPSNAHPVSSQFKGARPPVRAPVKSSSSLPNRPTGVQPKERVKQERAKLKRPSPAVSTPRFDSDTSSSSEESEPSKRRKIAASTKPSNIESRQIRDVEAYEPHNEASQSSLPLLHAADIANLGTDASPHPNYTTFFTALHNDEDESPFITLQYPTPSSPERYQLIQGKASDDFKPLDEIIHVIETIAKYYLPSKVAEPITTDSSSGILRTLNRARTRGHQGQPGAQTLFIEAITAFNTLLTPHLTTLIPTHFDNTHTSSPNLDLPLVERVLSQIYTRTVSPLIHTLKAYQNGTDNVYGELLPRFCSEIFSSTNLSKNSTFVDLGSGVGNVVLQAALQIGCDSWGCEMMPNACDLADLQAREFRGRCRLWGLKPGTVHLERGDFLTSIPIASALKKADVVLVNNQAFTPKLNDQLKLLFLDLKDGCRIVSLKSFVPVGKHRITKRNEGSVVNLLSIVAEKEYFSGSVSWTDASGKWFVQAKDEGRVRDFRG